MFFHFPQLLALIAALVPVVLSVCILSYVRRKGWKQWVQFVAFLFCLLAGLAFLLFAVLTLFGIIASSRPGKPIYSPDHRMAALISYSFEGESTNVNVYSLNGLGEELIFVYPKLKAVSDEDVRWLDNKHLVIHYQRDPRFGASSIWCLNTGDIEVQCIAKPAP